MLELQREEIILEKRRYAAQLVADRFGALSASSLRYAEQQNYDLDCLIKQISIEVLTRKLVDKTYEAVKTISFPSSWWEHLKRDHAPKWFLKFYPVKEYDEKVKLSVEFERYATYPEADIELPSKFGTMYLYEKVNEIYL